MTRGSSLPTAPNRPIRWVRARVAVVLRGTPDQRRSAGRTRPPRGRRACPGRPPSSGRRRRRGRAAAARACCRSTPSVRCSTFAIASPAAASASAGLASTSFWYSATAPSMSPSLERVLRRRRSAGRPGSSPVSSSTAAALGRGWCRPVTPCAVSCCITWVSASAAPRAAAASWSSGIGRPWAPAPPAGSTGSASPARSAATASMSTRPSRKRPSNSSDRRLQVVGEGAALGHPGPASRTPAGPVPSSTARAPPGSSPR